MFAARRPKKKNVELIANCDDSLKMLADARMLEQAIVNLVDNAIKFSDAGGAVVVVAEATEDRVRISVSDNGPGIPKEHIPHLFERFYRVDKGRSRREGGTGLGLSIVKHVVQAHEGIVSVKSRLGRETVFTIEI